MPAHFLHDVLDRAAERSPDSLAIIVDDDRLTYAELRETSEAFAKGLLARGIGVGDRVAILMPNRPEWLVVAFACSRIGAVIVPVNTWYREREIAFVLVKAQVKAVVSQRSFLSHDFEAELAAIAESEPQEGTVDGGSTGSWRDHVIWCGDAPEGADSMDDIVELGRLSGTELDYGHSASSVAAVFFTSGTTSFPKGAMVRHEGLVRNSRLLAARLQIGARSSYYCPVPFFHVAGLSFVVLAGMHHECTIVSAPRFLPEHAWEQIRTHRCEHTGGFEAIFHGLLENRRDDESSSLRTAWWAGGPPPLFSQVEQTLGVRLLNAYGLTEAHGNVTSTPLDWPLDRRSSSNGIPLEGVTVEILDEAGVTVTTGVRGQIAVSGWSVMDGYVDDPTANSRTIDSDGRLMTGDQGFIDEDGVLHYSGRGNEMVKIGGENVSPAEVEEALSRIDGVAEVAVCGVPHDRYGERLVAFVRSTDGEIDAAEIQSTLRQSIASFKIPKTILQVEAFPRTSTGKIRKVDLIADFNARHGDDAA